MEVNYLAVLVAALVNMALGALWYSPALFGKQWMAIMGYTPEMMKNPDMKKKANKGYFISFVGALVMYYVLAHVMKSMIAFMAQAGSEPVSAVHAGLMGGFWMWLGFVAVVTLDSVLWEGKPWKFWLINNSYRLVTLLIGGVILAVWM